MEQEFIEKLLIALRVIIVIGTNLTMMTILMNSMLVRKRSLKLFVAWCVIKTLVLNVLFNVILIDVYEKNLVLFTIYTIVLISTGIFLCFPILYTYEGSLGKIFLVQMASEMLAAPIGSIAMFISNKISGQVVLEYYLPFIWSDLLIPVFALPFFYILYIVSKPLLHRIRKMQMNYVSKIMYVVYIIWIAGSLYTCVGSLNDSTKRLFYIMFTLIITGAIALFLDTYQKETLHEQLYLKKQQDLYKMHYESIGSQILLMEKAIAEMNEHMENILKLDVNTEEGSCKVIEYLKGLKLQAANEKCGLYCNDWLIDSVFYHYDLICKNMNVKTEFSCQVSDYGSISVEDISKILMFLLDGAVKLEQSISGLEEKKLILKVFTVKNQIIIKMECDTYKKRKIAVISIKEYIKAYKGYLHQIITNNRIELSIMLQK